MTERAPQSRRQGKSGEHPAVQAYRAKLESIDEGITAAKADLDRKLEEFMHDMKTPVPTVPPEPEHAP